jgi:hypothetical protein
MNSPFKVGCVRFWNYEEWEGTVPHLAHVPVFGWAKGMEPSSTEYTLKRNGLIRPNW